MRNDFVGFRVVVNSPVEVAERPGQSPAGTAEPPSGLTTQPAAPAAKELTLDVGNDVTMKLVLIPAGTFLMGSPKSEKDRNAYESQHEVTISKPFYMGVYEVTQAQYEQVMGKNPSTGNYRGPTNPVGNMRCTEAAEFCKKLSQKTGKTVRLPTEAEWEFACRAGSTNRFYYGDDDDKLDDYAWYGKNSPDKTHEVGQKKPNAWGLYDMHGNVGEWVNDWMAAYANAKSVVDPTGPENSPSHTFRGGCVYHNSLAPSCRSAYRQGEEGKNMATDVIGFRVAVDLK
jgi:formylglycine-generating enzyme required for sulfatase activity